MGSQNYLMSQINANIKGTVKYTDNIENNVSEIP